MADSDSGKQPDTGKMLDMIYEIFVTASQEVKDKFPDETRRVILIHKLIIGVLKVGTDLQMTPMDIIGASAEFQVTLLKGFKLFAETTAKDGAQDQKAMNEVAKKILEDMNKKDDGKSDALDRK